MKIMILIVSIPIIMFLLFFLWASYPWELSPYSYEGKILKTRELLADELFLKPTTYTVLTWNIAYGHGIGSEGVNYIPKSIFEYQDQLEKMAQVIKNSEADLVLLQEVDFGAQRSHSIDELAFLSEKTGLNFYAPAVSWKNNYVPFPSSPLHHQFGKMKSGAGVLSRYPIAKNTVHLLTKPLSKPWWYNLFYLFRINQEVEIEIGSFKLKVLNLHLEAYDKNTRQEQARYISKEYLKTQDGVDLIGGDFNTTPSMALKKSGFSHPDDDYENDMTYEIFEKTSYKDVLDAQAYKEREDLYFTFPSINPDRRLDYIFYKKELILLNSSVVKEGTNGLSDHLPLKATFKLYDPTFIKD